MVPRSPCEKDADDWACETVNRAFWVPCTCVKDDAFVRDRLRGTCRTKEELGCGVSASLSPVVTMHTLPLHNIPPPLRKVAVVAVVEDAEECGPPVLRSAIVEWIRKNTSSLKVCVCLRLRGREENRSESAKRPHIPPRPSPRPLAACCAHASARTSRSCIFRTSMHAAAHARRTFGRAARTQHTCMHTLMMSRRTQNLS